ncbi:uncharacterized protein GGS25DRAFT_469459 [Hypoxylon fragiforme]|uniref:uncharacterized protein n=1 Tax=Hypoxylon fragiforme TaxID=63214 RepID=UPI0020C6092C|nr:uncharacterized protein GGS25DRAFT_469459 [Hypoxylon fragiforme]KAI2613885.1 hypothetical protein GGS25DRAFT_469459 [Hypoxylon fragiforme]
MYNTSNSLVLPSTSYVYVYTFLRDCAASGCLDPWFYLMCQLASSPPVDNKASQWQRRGEACFCFCSLVDRTVMCRKSGRYNNRGNSNLSYVAALRATRSILTGLSEAIRRERTPHTFGGIWCIMVPTLCIITAGLGLPIYRIRPAQWHCRVSYVQLTWRREDRRQPRHRFEGSSKCTVLVVVFGASLLFRDTDGNVAVHYAFASGY